MLNEYVSVDIETTGTDPERHSVLEIGAVLDNGADFRDLPRFRMTANVREATMQPYAAWLNRDLLYQISTDGGDCELSTIGKFFSAWINQVWPHESSVVFAGKNVAAFDWQFLKRLKGMENVRASHRFLDPGNLYWVPSEDGFKLPDLPTCLKRAGMSPVVTHRAIEDAELVVRLIRRHVESL